MSTIRDLAHVKKSPLVATSPLGRFVDRLLQTFEDCRSGLTDEALRSDAGVERFFLDLYERETERLDDTIRDLPLMSPEAKRKLKAEVDQRIRQVVIPGYVRHARNFTPKERNDFYLVPEKFHALERIGFGAAGVLFGLFVVAAPFIPLWSKEWVIPFMIGGLIAPNIRRYLALRKYEKQLNQLVSRADRELARIDVAYLTSGDELGEQNETPEDDEHRRKLAALAAQQQRNKEP